MPPQNPSPESKTRGHLREAVKTYTQVEKVAQIALVLPSAVLIGWLGGTWLGNHFHQPWMALVGFLLGCIAGFSSVIRMAMTMVNVPEKGSGGDADPKPPSSGDDSR